MKIEWWMLDGGICLIILISAIIGAAKGIGDTVLRLFGLAGGLVLGVFYSDRVTAWLKTTAFSRTVHDHLYLIIRNASLEDNSEVTKESLLNNSVTSGPDPYIDAVPKAISSTVRGLADKAADAAADKLTETIMGVMGFILIVLAAWFLVAVIRALYKSFRKSSVILGFTDRLVGFVLGTVKGIIVACIAAAALVPIVTWLSPGSVPALLEAMDETRIAQIFYNVNPLLLIIKWFDVI